MVNLPELNQMVPDVTYDPVNHVFVTPIENYDKLADYVHAKGIQALLRIMTPKTVVKKTI
jgi:hypothetical protein